MTKSQRKKNQRLQELHIELKCANDQINSLRHLNATRERLCNEACARLEASHRNELASMQERVMSQETEAHRFRMLVSVLEEEVKSLRELLHLSIEKSNYPAVPPMVKLSHSESQETVQRASIQ